MTVHPDRWAERYTKILSALDADDVRFELSEVAGLLGRLTAANRPDVIGRVVVGVLSAYAARCADRELDAVTPSAMDAHQAAALAVLGVQ